MNEQLALLGGRPILRQPLQEPNQIGNEEIEQALRVLKTGRLSGFVARYNEQFFGGPWVQKLEQRFREYFGVKFAISVNSATSGLFSSVYALGIAPSDEVIITPYTMTATASSILACSAIPVFVDVAAEDFCIDAQRIEAAITERTRAIMVVHLFGNPADMDCIMAIAEKHNLAVIEDCAQAPGAIDKNRLVGTFGDIGIFSLNRHKTIQTGEGGVVITNDEKLAFKLQLIRNHAETVVEQMGAGERFNLIGWNYRMTELEAAIGAVQIRRLDRLNAQRILHANYLSERLRKFSWLIPNQPRPKTKAVYYRYPFRYLRENLGIKRSTLAQAMRAEGFPLNEGYEKPLYLQSIYQKKAANVPYLSQLYSSGRSYAEGLCPVAEQLYKEQFLFSAITHLARDKRELDLFIHALKTVELNIEELKRFEKKD